MTEELIMTLGTDAIRTMMFLAAPMLLAAMVIGIMVSILQAITQINEATLTFIPKMLAVILVLAMLAPWMLKTMKSYTASVFEHVVEVRR